MNTYAEMALVAAAVVYAVDVSGFTESWRDALARALRVKVLRPLPPFDCGKCAAFWAALIVAVVRGAFGAGTLAFAALLSLLSLPAREAMLFIIEALAALFDRLTGWTTRR